jgi:uridine nucleosidase
MVHGRNGLGEVDYPEPKGKPDPRHAAQFIVDTIMANPGEITLVAVGPLTNVALAISLEPRLAENVKQVVLMGGAANVPGNVSAVAEANIHNDPEAANIVFNTSWPVVQVGLDVTTKTIMSPAYMEELRSAGNRYTDFIYNISRHYTNFYKTRGVEGFHVHDSSAIAYVIDPTLFTTRQAFVDVEYHSPYHAGHTIADWNGRRGRELNTKVCVDVDSARFLDLYRQRLTEGVA